MSVARPGLLIGGGLLVAFGLMFLGLVVHWFDFVLLGLGATAIGLSVMTDAPSPAPSPAAGPTDLEARLGELDRLHHAGILTDTEHGRARKRAIDRQD